MLILKPRLWAICSFVILKGILDYANCLCHFILLSTIFIRFEGFKLVFAITFVANLKTCDFSL
jgi:hypothetical protein